jgi:hydroxymethylpyrimidine/phosphomethylpyrimidine kinase
VLIKGGHGTGPEAIDVLLLASGEARALPLPRLDVSNTHGTGCTLSAAIAALLATGVELPDAVVRAKSYVWQALVSGEKLRIGQGCGPVDHLYAIRRHEPPA